MKAETTFWFDLYKALPKSVRDQDIEQANLLERYLFGPQLVWEGNQDIILSLNTLFDVDAIADEWLVYLKWTLGWTSETALDDITKDLTPDELRKLLRVSADLWKMKGTELGVKNAVRVITGRDVVIWNWFYQRWILGVTGLWRLGVETDPWLVGSAEGDRDEYKSHIWVHNEVDIQRDLIRKVVNLNRPLQEVVTIGYADLVDDFRFGRQKWVTDTGPDVVWDDVNFRLIISSGTVIRANVPAIDAAGEVVWRHRCAFAGASGGSVQMDVRRQASPPNDRYRATWNQDGTVELEYVQSGIPSTVATGDVGHALPQDETTFLGVDVWDDVGGKLRIQVIVYDDVIIDHVVDVPDVLPPGQWRFANVSVNDVRIDDVVAYEHPLTVDQVSGSGIVVG